MKNQKYNKLGTLSMWPTSRGINLSRARKCSPSVATERGASGLVATADQVLYSGTQRSTGSEGTKSSGLSAEYSQIRL